MYRFNFQVQSQKILNTFLNFEMWLQENQILSDLKFMLDLIYQYMFFT